MQPERIAVAWVLLIVLGLLLGLLVLVVAFGVVRHLRRQRPRSEREHPRRSRNEDSDEPAEWRSPGGPNDADD